MTAFIYICKLTDRYDQVCIKKLAIWRYADAVQVVAADFGEGCTTQELQAGRQPGSRDMLLLYLMIGRSTP